MKDNINYINKAQIDNCLSMKNCIDIMSKTLELYSKKEYMQNLRSVFKVTDKNLLGLMPGYLKSQKVFGTKIITVFPDNKKHNKPSHQGMVMIFDDTTGELKAIVDGEAITAKRTAAVSAVATNILARKDATNLALLGAGLQADMHIASIKSIRPIDEVRVWSISYEEAKVFAKEMTQKYDIKVIAVKEARDAVYNASVICTLTPAIEPILFGEWVSEGTHINAVGACAPVAREVDSSLVSKSRIFVDSYQSALNESGDLLIPISEGIIDESSIAGEIGEVILGNKVGREYENEITFFESLGLAVEDIAVAEYVYQQLNN